MSYAHAHITYVACRCACMAYTHMQVTCLRALSPYMRSCLLLTLNFRIVFVSCQAGRRPHIQIVLGKLLFSAQWYICVTRYSAYMFTSCFALVSLLLFYGKK